MEATTIAAFISTTAISLAPNVLLFLFPNYKPSDASAINPLDIGQALAAGGLLGDVFLHTLPHEMNEANGDVIGLAILAGFVVFLLFDILVRSYHCDDHDHKDHDPNKGCDQSKKSHEEKKNVMNSAAVLNLAADSLHNFTDGIAIGASFAGVQHDATVPMASQIKQLLKSRGGLASLAVLFHEIPHELGDYAILVSAGMSKKQAILAQFSTAIAAYCGTFVGLFGMQSMKDFIGSDIMVPFTAGGFVYLSTVTILSGLLEQKVQKKARMSQIVAFLMGIGFMYGVAMLEHHGGGCAHGHSHAHHDHGHGHSHGHHDHGHHHHDIVVPDIPVSHDHDHGHHHHDTIVPDIHDSHDHDHGHNHYDTIDEHDDHHDSSSSSSGHGHNHGHNHHHERVHIHHYEL